MTKPNNFGTIYKKHRVGTPRKYVVYNATTREELYAGKTDLLSLEGVRLQLRGLIYEAINEHQREMEPWMLAIVNAILNDDQLIVKEKKQ